MEASTTLLAAAIGRGDVGENCFATSTATAVASELALFCSLASIHKLGGGRPHGGKKKRGTSSFALAQCHNVVIPEQDCTVTMEVTAQPNLASVDRASIAEQCQRSREVDPCISWDVVESMQRTPREQFLAVTIDLTRIALGSTKQNKGAAAWEHTATLGSGLRLSVSLKGGSKFAQGARPVAVPDEETPSTDALATVHESIFSVTANETKGILDISIAVPAFFLDKAKGLREEPGMHTLEWILPSGVALEVSLRRNPSAVPLVQSLNAGTPAGWTPVATSSGPQDTTQVATRCNGETPPTLSVRITNWSMASVDCSTVEWVPVAVAQDASVDLMLSLTACNEVPALPEEVTGGETGLHWQVYAHVYELLRPRPHFGLSTLRMPEIAGHCEQQGSFIASHPQSIRDAVRHYIVSARRGSPEKPRPLHEEVDGGQRRTQSTARSIPSHDF